MECCEADVRRQASGSLRLGSDRANCNTTTGTIVQTASGVRVSVLLVDPGGVRDVFEEQIGELPAQR
jgi:hypothetical protein